MTIIPSLDWTTNYIWGIDDDAPCEVDVRGKCRGVLSRPAELWKPNHGSLTKEAYG